ncbi:uracil-DNA glycosylase family protein [Halomarina halobia]|uniref:Uracil-DNA glycosylase family protein n=1 Tax=Halomarina halobia TaxID=3033386 RepID=A0ABD6A3I7_9EURY|nr:uracil-DNA glycosylase family protein [Halomarina sp. PSR21]
MDAEQDTLVNPFGMDETCTNCPELCGTRERVVHGYGPVDAEFLVVGEMPGPEADASGVPFDGTPVLDVLERVGFVERSDGDVRVENAYLTYLTRCRHPERGPTDAEVLACDGYLTAEIRMINPEIIVPVGQRVCEALATEYTTRDPGDFDVEAEHATTVRGRGFELVPLHPDPDDDRRDEFVAHLGELLGRDYRQTKGRRGR